MNGEWAWVWRVTKICVKLAQIGLLEKKCAEDVKSKLASKLLLNKLEIFRLTFYEDVIFRTAFLTIFIAKIPRQITHSQFQFFWHQ